MLSESLKPGRQGSLCGELGTVDLDTPDTLLLNKKIEFAVEVIAMTQSLPEEARLIEAARNLAECLQNMDLMSIRHQLAQMYANLHGLLKSPSVQKSPAVEKALIDALLSFPYQNNVSFIWELVNNGFLEFAKMIADRAWAERRDDMVYQAIYLVSKSIGNDAEMRVEMRNAMISKFKTPEGIFRAVSFCKPLSLQKCQVMEFYASGSLSLAWQKLCINAIVHVFENAPTPDHFLCAARTLWHLVKKPTVTLDASFFQKPLHCMLTARVEGIPVLCETALYVTTAMFSHEELGTKIDIPITIITEFLESDDGKCQIAACDCLCTIIDVRRDLIMSISFDDFVSFLIERYFNVTYSARKYMNRLIIKTLHCVDREKVMEIIQNRMLHLLPHMSGQVFDASMNDVVQFYHEIFNLTDPVTLPPIWRAFEEEEGFATLRELLSDWDGIGTTIEPELGSVYEKIELFLRDYEILAL